MGTVTDTSRIRINTASLVNGCSDMYTKLDVENYNMKLDAVEDTMSNIPGILITMFVFIILSVLCLTGTMFFKCT